MKATFKSSRLTYKSLFGYSLVIIALLVVAVPVLASNRSGGTLLDFSRSAETGLSPQTARTLSSGANVDHLNPGEENWYTYNRDSFSATELAWISLALRYKSEARLSPDQVNFTVMVQQAAGTWFETPKTPEEVLGMGLRSPVSSAEQNLTESFWTGQVGEQGLYYVRVFNNSPFGLDYTLEAKAEQPAVSGASPASFSALTPGGETLNAQQLRWTLTAQAVANMTAGEAAAWMQNAQAVGWIITTGTAPESVPDPAKASPQLLWQLTAQATAGQEPEQAARWLLQADSLGWLSIPLNTAKDPNPVERGNTGGGGGGDDGGGDGGGEEPPARPVPPDEVYTPVNIYPNNPLDFNFHEVNSGRLAPYGEHWYSLLRDDLDKQAIEDLKLTMFFTPREGFMSDRINFEIFPASQYQIWLRGDSDYMEHLGAGQWVSRDEDPQTGERLWSGSLVDGDRYLIKVKNGTAEMVDYYLFPGDVENAELGNPTLIRGDGTAGRIPYAASPPTKPAAPPVPGSNPVEAIQVKTGIIKGRLEAGQVRWYQFTYGNPANDSTPPHHFTIAMTNKPADSLRARHADFALYAGNQLDIWTRGTTDQLEPFGTSSPSLDKPKQKETLKVLWDGQLMEEHIYYLKVYNHDVGPLEYELEIKGGQ